MKIRFETKDIVGKAIKELKNGDIIYFDRSNDEDTFYIVGNFTKDKKHRIVTDLRNGRQTNASVLETQFIVIDCELVVHNNIDLELEVDNEL